MPSEAPWPELLCVLCIQPEKGEDASYAGLQQYVEENRERVREFVHSGGILLRGWKLQSTEEAEALFYGTLGMKPLAQHTDTFLAFNARATRLNVPPDGIEQRANSRTAPHAKPGAMQPAHVEYGFGPLRPRCGAFFCELPPVSAGQTALVDMCAVLASLPHELTSRLEMSGWWNPRAAVGQPCLLRHPSGRRVLGQLWLFTDTLCALTLKAYRTVAMAAAVEATGKVYPHVDRMDTCANDKALDYGFALLDERGKPVPLAAAESAPLLESVYRHTAFLSWQRGDLLIWDNVLLGHFRMPGSKPRKLHAFFGDEIDVRTLHERPGAPAVVLEHATKRCKAANTLLRETLGIGGYEWLLWGLCFVPDWLFVVFGRLLWANPVA